MKSEMPIVAIQLFSISESSDTILELLSSDAIIVRGDYIENDDQIKNISLTKGVNIFSLKSVQYGGKFEGTLDNRYARLIRALDDYDIIELESETDLTAELLRIIPPSRRIISWYGKAESFEELENSYKIIKATDARYHKIVLDPRTISEGIWSLQLLKKYENENLISYADGAIGLWTQLLSVYLGSQMISGRLNRNEGADTLLTYDQLKNEYNLPNVRSIKQLFGIAGNPVFASLSPLIHNKCYEFLEMDALYLPFHIERFDDFWNFINTDFPSSNLGLNLGGFTMVSPFKEETFNAAKRHLSEPTLRSKACNILINKNGEWYSDSSDGLGVLAALKEENVSTNGLKVAIIGCGGAGRTIASRLMGKGTEIVMFNRSEDRGMYASNLLGLPFVLIEKFDASEFDIVVNATPVGKHGKKLIFDPSQLKSGSLAIDMAYTKDDTLLVSGCRKNGKQIIEGKQILLHQVKKQFTGLTGREMPIEVELLVREKTANVLKIN